MKFLDSSDQKVGVSKTLVFETFQREAKVFCKKKKIAETRPTIFSLKNYSAGTIIQPLL